MNKLTILVLFLLMAFLSACKKDSEPSPQAVGFTLTEATLGGQPISPLPAYAITLHWDAAGVPTMYEVAGSHASAPAPGQKGTWVQNGTQLTFTSQDGSQSHQVQVSGAEVSVLSSRVELSWSLGKTEIAWPLVGDYTYSFERID